MQPLTASMQIAAKLSSGLGREVVHVKLSEEEELQRFLGIGIPEHIAKLLTRIEIASTNGKEERLNDAVEKVTGRPPQTFDT